MLDCSVKQEEKLIIVMVIIKLFGNLADIVGKAEEGFELDSKINTIADLVAWYLQHKNNSALNKAIATNKIRFAKNHQLVTANTKMQDNDIIAIMPKVSGG